MQQAIPFQARLFLLILVVNKTFSTAVNIVNWCGLSLGIRVFNVGKGYYQGSRSTNLSSHVLESEYSVRTTSGRAVSGLDACGVRLQAVKASANEVFLLYCVLLVITRRRRRRGKKPDVIIIIIIILYYYYFLLLKMLSV